MAPGYLDETKTLRRRIVELEGSLQKQHQAATARFRALAESAPFMIWTAGPDAMCTYFNRAWLEYRGRRLEDETGNGWTAGLHPDDRDLFMETYLRAFASRQPFRVQTRMERSSGEYGWLEITGGPEFDESGDYGGFLGSATDVSDRKRGHYAPDEASARLVFSLTERERQVLVLIANGKSTKEAALRLGISYKTCDSHRSRILEKLGVHETASMVRYAIRAGLVEP
ncbi:MAG TPA: LuxR C-terminal-related transcriptional regulator [Candidatus Limnocylindrales bacterium]|nr:LuxR C-terminal-related transcriptional regulator [Candidatus Limnocylindrales bacterium]